MQRLIQCPFRHGARQEEETEVAVCRLLQQLSEVDDPQLCEVRRDACEACSDSFAPSVDKINPIVASLLFDLAGRVVERGGVDLCDIDRAIELQRRAESHLEVVAPDDRAGVVIPKRAPDFYLDRSFSCDVVICCADDSEQTHRAMRSVLDQKHVAVHIHMVDDSGGAGEMLARYAQCSNVSIHRNPRPIGLFATLHNLVPQLRTDFVAVQDPHTTSRPFRLAYSVGLMSEFGGEFLGAPLQTPSDLEWPRSPALPYRHYLPAPTLVIRRATLVDMGGVADRVTDAGAELVYRAASERRQFVFARQATVEADASWSPTPLGPPPVYEFRDGTLRHQARGFRSETAECDVVLPFHGHFDYVDESMAGLLEQEGAEVLVHLVDDATPGGAEDLLRRWGRHARIRIYRNTRNIGQFATFNNIIPFVETGLVAVQDADDISLPHRLHLAGNALRLADADIFGGRVQLFGSELRLNPPLPKAGVPAQWRRRPRYRASHYPAHRRGYFLENPTAVMRPSAFKRLGGFGDFGDIYRNRCGLDTEFYLRSYYAGARFAISKQVVLNYRCHPDSATQNALTGWGSLSRSWSEEECSRRSTLYQQGPFDPALYGGLRNFAGVTKRIQL